MKILNSTDCQSVKKISIKIFLFFLFISTLSCKEKSATKEATSEPISDEISVSETQFRNMNLEFATISENTMSEELKVTGMTDVPPDNVASVSMPISGFIKTLTHNVLEGKFVTKGSVLATIQSMEVVQIQQDYLQAQSQESYLEKELERQKSLVVQDATASKKAQQAEADFKQNQVLLKSLEAKLKILNISVENLRKGEVQTNLAVFAPISGFIKSSNVNLGKNISPSDVLFEIVSKEHIHLELKVLEKDAFKIKEGQKVIINDARFGGEASGRVFLIGKSFEEESKSLNVHVHLDDEAIESKLIPQMFINAKILVEPRKTTTLPENCILRENEQTFVFMMKNQEKNKISFEKKAVKIGISQQELVEVYFDEVLPTNTKFVSKGVNTLVGLSSAEGE